jgi:gliding motility-associated-like protein
MIKKLIIGSFFVFNCLCYGQYIQVDSQTFTPQQLVEDILIDSECINDVVVTNVVGGNFNNSDQSYGFFDATGTNFPLEQGVILATGRLLNAPGPNTSLSDDDAPGWVGDEDLETILNEPETFNATILEFDFTSVASQVSFRYIFASEEYQEDNPSTCVFSDLFGFLIKPINEQQYTNIALVPDTQTPVKVTTVHPEIPDGCQAQNEFYFDTFNDTGAAINYTGQTKALTATANIIPNETYHVKLVIADEKNFRYDSAVFLEAGSFQLSINLGPNRLLSTGNPICGLNTVYTIDAFEPESVSYKWFKDDIELLGETNDSLDVTAEGTYSVEITLSNNCVSYGEVVIEYSENPTANNATLTACDLDQDGLTTYDLFDAEPAITNNDSNLFISGFFLSQNDAELEINQINSPNSFNNFLPNQLIFARVVNLFGCSTIAELRLEISNNTISIPEFSSCDTVPYDGLTSFNLNQLQNNIALLVPEGAIISFYENVDDALSGSNSLGSTYQNTIANSQTIYTLIELNSSCYSIAEVQLQVLETPILEEDITQENPIYYCLNSFPETITLNGGVLNDIPNNFYYEWNTGETTMSIEINEVGTYSVVVTDPNGCSNSRTIVVSPSNLATIDEVIIEDLSNNNSITLIVSGEGSYEFAIDNINGSFQESNRFDNVSPGFHTIYVRDRNGCGIVSQLVSVKGFPLFFTPNNDGFFDTWQIIGVNNEFNTVSKIYIYDRYGKLLKELDPLSTGWNGTSNGRELPSTDYWFLAEFTNGQEFRGHFALVR